MSGNGINIESKVDAVGVLAMADAIIKILSIPGVSEEVRELALSTLGRAGLAAENVSIHSCNIQMGADV